jgi:YD repeat-containing protein
MSFNHFKRIHTVKKLFFLPLLLIGYGLFAQTSNNALAFPSANNSFLGKIESGTNVGVDLYTGTAQVSIPVCSLASKELTIPVSLDYVDGRGVKVQEYASQVGLGWQLNAGGSISRVVRGFPDEQTNGYLGTGQWGKIVTNGSTNPDYTNFFETITQSNAFLLTGLQQTNDEPRADGEPDLFYVKTPFFSFQFVFDQNGNPVCSNSTGYKIIPTNFINNPNPGGQSSSFEVIDDQGNQFYFGNASNSTELATDSIFGQVPPAFITSWYLTKIISYNSKDVVTFNYQAAPTNDTTHNYSWMETQYGTSQPITTTRLSTGKTVFSTPKFISTIVSSLGELDFYYTYSRLDDPNVPYLASIITKSYNPQSQSNSTTLQTFNFNYNYFNPSSNSNLLRLELEGITVTGNTSATGTPLNLASFGYNTSANLPDRTLPVFDYWGYCTTMPNPIPSDIFNINRAPNITMAQADLLNAVTTLSGDTWLISYELNAYNSGSGSTDVGGLRVTKIAQTLPTGENIYKTYQYADANGNSYGEIYSSNYKTLQVTTTTGSPSFIVYFSSSPYTVNEVNGIFVGYSYVKETDQNGGYIIYNFSNFNDFNDFSQPSSSTSSFLLTPTTSFSYKRGLLRNQSVYNANGSPISEIQKNYSALSNPVTNSGYGLRVVLLPDSPQAGGVWNTYGYYSTPVENYRLTQVISTDYDQATPANSITTTTNYTYDTFDNWLIQAISTTDSKGLAHTQTIYHAKDVANTGITQIDQIPITSAETSAINTMISSNKINVVIHSVDNRNNTINQVHNTYTNTTAVNNNIYCSQTSAYTSDPVNTGYTLVKQQSFVFDPASSNLISSSLIGGSSTAVAYGYNSSLPTAKVVNASSSTTLSAVIAGTSVTLSNGTSNAPQTIPFTVGANGTITTSLTWPTLPPSGSTNEVYVSYSITGPIGFTAPVNASLCISSNHDCSAYTNTVSSLWACVPGNYVLTITSTQNPQNNFTLFQVTYPSTTLTSVFTNEFFYEGFEQTGNITTSAHTGNMSYSGTYSVPFTLPDNRSYVIQWWSFTGGSWVFNQQAYTMPVSLSGQIDDVRIFPKDALMTTYTYNPLVGETSETDPSGRSQIYQYDGLNRLQTIRDQDNNIVKQYDYEYQSCVSTVDNTAQSGSYIKQGCPVNTAGSTVQYVVPAGKYAACSLSAANQLALNDVSFNGQNYANANGTCNPSTCTAPGVVSVVPLPTSLYIAWNYPPGVGTDAYGVIVTNVATGVAVMDDFGTASPLTVTGLSANTQYKVVIESLCSGTPASTPVIVTTTSSAPPCTPPTTITVVPSSTSMVISWDYPPGVGTNAYAVFVTNVATGVQVADDYGAASPLTVTGLSANTQYKVVIESLCSGDPASQPVIVTTSSPTCTPVINSASYDGSTGQKNIVINYTPATGSGTCAFSYNNGGGITSPNDQGGCNSPRTFTVPSSGTYQVYMVCYSSSCAAGSPVYSAPVTVVVP